MQETWVPSLGQEDPLQEEMATHASILAWETPWTEELGGLQSMGSQKNRTRLGGSTAAINVRNYSGVCCSHIQETSRSSQENKNLHVPGAKAGQWV